MHEGRGPRVSTHATQTAPYPRVLLLAGLGAKRTGRCTLRRRLSQAYGSPNRHFAPQPPHGSPMVSSPSPSWSTSLKKTFSFSFSSSRCRGAASRIVRIVKVVGYVASAPGFTAQPQVVNGASELLGEVFGDAGRHARSAVGVAVLPLDAPVEVELIAEVRPD